MAESVPPPPPPSSIPPWRSGASGGERPGVGGAPARGRAAPAGGERAGRRRSGTRTRTSWLRQPPPLRPRLGSPVPRPPSSHGGGARGRPAGPVTCFPGTLRSRLQHRQTLKRTDPAAAAAAAGPNHSAPPPGAPAAAPPLRRPAALRPAPAVGLARRPAIAPPAPGARSGFPAPLRGLAPPRSRSTNGPVRIPSRPGEAAQRL